MHYLNIKRRRWFQMQGHVSGVGVRGGDIVPQILVNTHCSCPLYPAPYHRRACLLPLDWIPPD